MRAARLLPVSPSMRTARRGVPAPGEVHLVPWGVPGPGGTCPGTPPLVNRMIDIQV